MDAGRLVDHRDLTRIARDDGVRPVYAAEASWCRSQAARTVARNFSTSAFK